MREHLGGGERLDGQNERALPWWRLEATLRQWRSAATGVASAALGRGAGGRSTGLAPRAWQGERLVFGLGIGLGAAAARTTLARSSRMRRRVQAREEAHGRLADLLAGRVAQRDDEVARAERGDAARAEPAAAHDAREQLEPGVARLWAAGLWAARLWVAYLWVAGLWLRASGLQASALQAHRAQRRRAGSTR